MLQSPALILSINAVTEAKGRKVGVNGTETRGRNSCPPRYLSPRILMLLMCSEAHASVEASIKRGCVISDVSLQ